MLSPRWGPSLTLRLSPRWCGHCKSLAPVFESAAASFAEGSRYNFGKVDATENPKLKDRFHVNG